MQAIEFQIGGERLAAKDEGDFLRFEGELGGLAWMQRFLYLFPLALGAFLALLFLTIGHFSGAMPPGIALLAPALALAPWVFLAPLLMRWLRARALSHVEALLHNARQLAQQDGA